MWRSLKKLNRFLTMKLCQPASLFCLREYKNISILNKYFQNKNITILPISGKQNKHKFRKILKYRQLSIRIHIQDHPSEIYQISSRLLSQIFCLRNCLHHDGCRFTDQFISAHDVISMIPCVVIY